jgi:CubicO group peptidase (beta-lactamase class C family)
MFRRLLIITCAFLLFAVGYIFLNPGLKNYIAGAPSMLTGMGAKLGCSSRYVSGFTQDQSHKDLMSYSPVLSLLALNFNDDHQRVEASFLGIHKTEAQFREGLGCTLELGDTAPLNNLAVPTIETNKDLEWPKGSNANAIDATLQQQLDQIVVRDNAAGLNTRALLVVHDGKLLAESYGPGLNSETQLLGWSMAKSLTAIMIGMLERDGLINSSDKTLFEAWKNDDRADINVEQLLTMSSGLDFKEDYEPAANATIMLFESISASDYAMQSSMAHAPGEHWYYSSGTTNLLSRLIYERLGASSQAYIDYLYQRVLQPLAMTNTTVELDPSGVNVGSSYIYSSGRDWARMGELMRTQGQLNDVRFVSQEWVTRAVTPNTSKNDARYGYQFWLNQGGEALRWPGLPKDSYAALGNRKQVVMIVPSSKAVIVRLGWTQGDYPTNDNFEEILNLIPADL